ncbi:hypothetical protein HEK41_024935 [Escherichia coli]|nr:hypothetical protein [Escherichia coli]
MISLSPPTICNSAHDLNNSGKANIKLIDLATFRKQYLEQPASTGLEF